jgi:hypothetical protein
VSRVESICQLEDLSPASALPACVQHFSGETLDSSHGQADLLLCPPLILILLGSKYPSTPRHVLEIARSMSDGRCALEPRACDTAVW